MKQARNLATALGALSLALAAAACGGHAHTQSTAANSSAAAARSAGAPATAATTPAPSRSPAPTGPASCEKQSGSAVAVHIPSGPVSLSGGVLAMVGHQSITAAQCQTQLTRSLAAGIPLGSPPDYSACVSAMRVEQAREQKALAKLRKGAPTPPTQSTAMLRRQCAARVTSLVQGALTQLIQSSWIAQQAAAQHITVSDAQVSAALAAQRRAFRSSKLYDQYLARAGLSQAQLTQQERMTLLEQKVYQARLGPPVTVTDQQVATYFQTHIAEFKLPHQPDPKLSTYAPRIKLVLEEQSRFRNAAGANQSYERRWKALTACRPGYVVALCANAPNAPGIA